MSTITFKVSDDEKLFIQSIADLSGLSVSELVRTKLLEQLENQIDMPLYEAAIKSHELVDKSISHQAMLRGL